MCKTYLNQRLGEARRSQWMKLSLSVENLWLPFLGQQFLEGCSMVKHSHAPKKHHHADRAPEDSQDTGMFSMSNFVNPIEKLPLEDPWCNV